MQLLQTGLGCWRDFLECRAAQQARRFGRRTRVFQRTASTNDVCWQAAGEASDLGTLDGLVVLADDQSRGRGRRGDPWLSRPGSSILLSMLWAQNPLGEALTLLLGLACAEVLESYLSLPVTIKWPNDLLIEGRKVAGILVESRQIASQWRWVLGLGLNVHQRPEDFPPELHATSLAAAGHPAPDRLWVIDALLERLEARCAGPLTDAWLDAWRGRCHMLGQKVRLRVQGQLVEGVVEAIEPLEGLILRDLRGRVHLVKASQATVLAFPKSPDCLA